MMKFRLLAAACATATAATLPALAQQNEVYIEQRGSGNQLTIDQSAAEFSTVRGLSMTRFLETFTDEPDSAALNVLRLSSQNQPERALQLGSANSASVTIEGGTAGEPNAVQLFQSSPAQGLGNSATLNLDGQGLLAAVGQRGSGNTATLNLLNDGTTGTILQAGRDNNAQLRVEGEGSTGFISQNGNNNNSGVVLVNGVNTSVTFIQNGNNATPFAGADSPGVSVISNAAAVTITQTTFGSGN